MEIGRLFGKPSASVETVGPDGGAGTRNLELEALAAQGGKGARRSKAQRAIEESAKQAEQSQLEELFDDPEDWEMLPNLYFDYRWAVTGFDGFKRTEKQRLILARVTTRCAKVLCKFDPRYVAMLMLCLNMGAQITDAELQYRSHKEQEKRDGQKRT